MRHTKSKSNPFMMFIKRQLQQKKTAPMSFVLTKRPVFKQRSIPNQKSNEAGRTGKNRTRIYSAWYNYINCFPKCCNGASNRFHWSNAQRKDLVHHINHVVAKDPKASYVFVMDQLNTHKPESLVRFVADLCGIPQDTLGKKGRVIF